jgi:hypothetical protein
MKLNANATLAAISAILLSSGCTTESGVEGELIYPDTTLLHPADIFIAGSSMNSGDYDGFGRMGTEIFAPTAEGTSSEGLELSGLILRDSILSSMHLATETPLSRTELVGATFRTVTPAGDPIELRIDAVDFDPALAPHIAVHRYTVVYRPVQETEWSFACGVGENGLPIQAIPLQHRWDYRKGVPGGGSKLDAPDWITFACDGFALAKCVDLGYKPWISIDDTSLGAHHQACTRMFRADYCGDGRSQGYPGLTVNVYDSLGIQPDPPNYWITESEWTAEGARCVRRSRAIIAPISGCTFELPAKVCGNPPHWDRTLLISEMP